VPKRISRLALAAGLTLAIGPAGLAGAAPKASLDGAWSVLVITESGDCDRAYRYPVRIHGGTVSYQGEAGVTVSGHVDGSGKVNVSVQRGQQSAHGTGRLASDRGSGTWTGRSPRAQCSGRWEAERRDT
jgi:hypothetical protein